MATAFGTYGVTGKYVSRSLVVCIRLITSLWLWRREHPAQHAAMLSSYLLLLKQDIAELPENILAGRAADCQTRLVRERALRMPPA